MSQQVVLTKRVADLHGATMRLRLHGFEALALAVEAVLRKRLVRTDRGGEVMSKRKYELESDSLVMLLYFGNREIASAYACTHGGWTIYLGKDDSKPVEHVESRRDVRQWLERRFPGLAESA
jgi:hypothetical protein